LRLTGTTIRALDSSDGEHVDVAVVRARNSRVFIDERDFSVGYAPPLESLITPESCAPYPDCVRREAGTVAAKNRTKKIENDSKGSLQTVCSMQTS
jgi:hypothetical protein